MSQYWDRKLSQIYNYSPAYPNVEPVAGDVESATQAPTACVQINRQLIPYLAGLCEVYRNPNFFRGDDARRVKSAEIMNDLQVALLNANECDHIGLEGFVMPIGTIFYNVSPTAPEGCLVMDGTVHAVDDYPELAALLPASWDAIYDIGEIGVSGFRLPDMNNTSSYLEAGPVAGDVTGTNTKTVPTSALEPHAHEFPQRQTFNLAVNSGGTPVVLGNQGVLLEDTNPAGGNVPMDFRTSRLTTYAYIVAKNLVSENVLDGPTGPTGADGPEGEPGPAGPSGPAGECVDCEGEGATPPEDSPIYDPGSYVSGNGFICSGARRMAVEVMDDVNAFLENAIAVSQGLLATTQVFKIVGWPGVALELFQVIGAPQLQGIVADITTDYIDELTCDFYCAINRYGSWTNGAFDAVKASRPLVDFDDLASYIPAIDSLDKVVSLALHLFVSFRDMGRAYDKGAVNSDNFCESFCNCDPCSPGTATIVNIFTDPQITIFPAPTQNANGDYFWPGPWTTVRIVFNDGMTRCIYSLRGTLKRGAAVSKPDNFEFRVAGEVRNFGEGNSGDNELIWNIGPAQSLYATIKPRDATSQNATLTLSADTRLLIYV